MRGYPGLARWPSFIKKDDGGESDTDIRTRKERRCYECTWPLVIGTNKEMVPPPEPQQESGLTDTFIADL